MLGWCCDFQGVGPARLLSGCERSGCEEGMALAHASSVARPTKNLQWCKGGNSRCHRYYLVYAMKYQGCAIWIDVRLSAAIRTAGLVLPPIMVH